MDKWKAKLNEWKEKGKTALEKIPNALRKRLLIGGAVLLVLAVGLAVILNHKEYSVLYSEVSQEDAAAIGSKLQELGVSYQYRENGDIIVPKAQEDQLRATLAYDGYPKSGFSYGVFIDNTGGMTTDSDAQTYKLYDLQNRLGATISLFDGVKDAKVTIALAEQQKYVLQEDAQDESSASVVVQMKSNETLDPEAARGIQNLVARSVAGMKAENVSVFDENGIELSGTDEDTLNSQTATQLTQTIENQIAGKVMNLLAPIYGSENVRVSVKATINMETLLRESITYTTPDKIDENDKQGIVSSEQTTQEQGQGGGQTGGIAGTETNADISNYDTVDGNGGESYSSESAEREYLVNQIKEQGQIDPGVLDDLSISAVINSNAESDADINMNQLKSLIGNAAGMEVEKQDSQISVLMAPFAGEAPQETLPVDLMRHWIAVNWIWLAAGGILILLFLLLLLLLRRRAVKKRRAKLEEEQRLQKEAAVQDTNPEIVKLKNEEGQNLRQNVRDFAEQNPEISAQLLKEWLNGGEKNE